MANAYSIHQDESRFKDPDFFEPMRYIDFPLTAQEAARASDPELRDHYAYGAGRRICAGMYVAEPSIFLLAARFLWAFDVRRPNNQSLEKGLPDTLNYSGTFAHSRPSA